MKVYMSYKGESEKEGQVVVPMEKPVELKMKIPADWMESPCSRLIDHFFDSTSCPGERPPTQEMKIRCGGLLLLPTDVIQKRIHEYNQLVIVHKAVFQAQVCGEGEARCTNYGCGKVFKVGENTATSCHFHSRPPVFHDTEKYWPCCLEKKCFDWESFEKLPACQTGPHSTQNPSLVVPH